MKATETVSKLDERDTFGYTPLHYAAKFNRYLILVKLVEAGAGIVMVNLTPSSPLHLQTS